jgi:hypothetical protein
MSMRVVASIIVALCLTFGSAGASSIGVFFSSDATDTDTCILQNTPFTIYIFAVLGGDAAANGITGAEYRLTGIDPAWFMSVIPNPSATFNLGSPIDGVGVNIGFPSCQSVHELLLHTISVFPLTPPAPRTLRIERRNPPSSPNWPCPLVRLCDGEPNKLCVPGGEAFIDCTVGVEPATWTQVKALYTN